MLTEAPHFVLWLGPGGAGEIAPLGVLGGVMKIITLIIRIIIIILIRITIVILLLTTDR